MEWRVTPGPTPYPDALAAMDARADAIHAGTADELIWLLEHPPLYTAGTSAQTEDLLDPRFPVYDAGRGGQYTYHGPGQRVVYLMLDLKARGRDVRAYVTALEEWIIQSLARLGVTGERRQGRVGVWVQRGPLKEDKIAAIGVRIRRWVTLHGIAINVSPDLSHFTGIVPCGIQEHGVTSLADLGLAATLADLDAALGATRPALFPDL
jgi:lipoyl(octanoyl) transferase